MCGVRHTSGEEERGVVQWGSVVVIESAFYWLSTKTSHVCENTDYGSYWSIQTWASKHSRVTDYPETLGQSMLHVWSSRRSAPKHYLVLLSRSIVIYSEIRLVSLYTNHA